MPPSPPSSQSSRRRSGERSREAKKEEAQTRRRAGNDSSEDSAPEVEFRAFMRSAQATSSQGITASPSFNASTGARPIMSNGKPAIPAGRMRGGAPRLGGLGLGGLANQQTAPRRAAPIPSSRPSSSSSAHKVRRKATPSTRYPDDFPVRPPPAFPPPSPTSSQQEELLQRRPVLVDSTVPSVQMKRSMSNIERPFLSPEMPVTTARVGAFALDRPVPTSVMHAPTVALPDSPPLKDRISLDERRSSIGSIALHPDDEHDIRYGQEEEEEGSFGLLQAALAEGTRQSTSAPLLVTPETDQGNRSFPSSPMDPTPPTSRPRFATPPQSDDDDEAEVFASPSSTISIAAPTSVSILLAPEFTGFSSSEDSPVTSEHPYRSSTSSNNASDTTDSAGPRTPPPVLRQVGSPLVRIVSAETNEFVPTSEQEIIQDHGEVAVEEKLSRSSSMSSFGSDQSSASIIQVATAAHISIPPPRSSSAARNHGPTPPRPKRMRMPAINSIVEPVAVGGLLGGDVPMRSRGLFADGEDIEDDGGGGGGAGAYSTDPARSVYRSSVVSSNSTTPSTALSRSASKSEPTRQPTPPLTSNTPPVLTSRAKLFLALEAEKEKERLRAEAEAADSILTSPDLANSPSSFISTSASEAESGNESFFYRPPPVRLASDQSAATITSSSERHDEPVVKEQDIVIESMAPLVSPPLVETPKMASLDDPTISPLVSPVSPAFSDRPSSTYFGLGLRLPSSITPTSKRNSSAASEKSTVAPRYFTAPIDFDTAPTPPRSATPPPIVEAPSPPVELERPASPIVVERPPSPVTVVRPSTPPVSTPVSPPSPVTPLAIPTKSRTARVQPPSAVVVTRAPSPPAVVDKVAQVEKILVPSPLLKIASTVSPTVEALPVVTTPEWKPIVFEATSSPPVVPAPPIVEPLPIPAVVKSVTPPVVSPPLSPLPAVPTPVEEVATVPIPEHEEEKVEVVEVESAPTQSYGAAVASTAASLAFSGGVLLGYGAWRGLTTAASVGGSSLSWGWKKMAEASEASAAASAELEPGSPSSKALGKRRATIVPGSFAAPIEEDESGDETLFMEAEETMTISTVDEVEYEVADDAESSIVETEWGDMHFPAPEGFLEDLKRAMADIGPEDLAENEKVEREAQEAAYAAASRVHDEAASPSTVESLPFPSAPSTIRPSHSRKQSNASARTLKTRARAEEANEMEELADQFSITSSDPPASPSRIANPRRTSDVFPSIPSNRQYSPSPSTRSITSERSSTISSGMTHSVSKRSLFGFGSVGRKRVSSEAGSFSSFASPTATSASLERTTSQLSSTSSNSNGKSSKRGSIFGGMKPSPSVESDIGNATYVSYSSGANKTKRRTSGAISMSDFFNAESPTSSIASDSRSIRRDRRSSLRRDSRYDMSKALALSESIAEGSEPVRKSIYTVRFANASGGSGLKSVAESEAERAGGESHGQRWVGIGRGRYGNMVLMSDEASDQMYAEQTLEIKKKWRGFGTQVDWAEVKID